MSSPTIRPFPYPYKAMLAICSDLDETPDSDRYFEIARFLNTTEETAAGTGVGLEVGNTIYFDMPDDQFAYWNTDDVGREKVRKLIRSGHIDTFHSFGDLATTREHAQRALNELQEHGCRIECWVDHAVAPTNVGADIMQGRGDICGDPAYHADLSYEHGVRFVWRGRVTSVIGQDRRRHVPGLVSLRNPVATARTTAIEIAKGVLGRRGNSKFEMHGTNNLARETQLRDGRTVLEFMRCNPHWGGLSTGDTGDGLADVLTDKFLNRLVKRRGSSILYTHLGKTRFPDTLFNPATAAALRQLADARNRGDILVTTTRRMLVFWLLKQYLTVSISGQQSTESVHINTGALRELEMPCELDGLTIYVRNSQTARLFVDGEEISGLQRNTADDRGQQSVSIPWRPLEFPAI